MSRKDVIRLLRELPQSIAAEAAVLGSIIIEQDADVVLLLHREDYYHNGQADYCNTNVADVTVAKQRSGPTGAIKLTFRPELSRFESYAPLEQ